MGMSRTGRLLMVVFAAVFVVASIHLLANGHGGSGTGSAIFALAALLVAGQAPRRAAERLDIENYLLGLALGSYAVCGVMVWLGLEATLGRNHDGRGYGVLGIVASILFGYLGTRLLLVQHRLSNGR